MTLPRAILVTGGASGLGAALARLLASAGNHVAIADINREAGQRLSEETGGLFVAADVGMFADNQAAVEATVRRFGRLDAVCLNAGVPGGTSIGATFDVERYRQCMRVNLDGVVYGANAALPHLRARGGGAILITSSIAALAPSPDLYYCAAKHALIGLMRSLALLLQGDHIAVNALCPGFIDTPLIDGVRDLLITKGFALADPDDVARSALSILGSSQTGQAWEVQAGRPAAAVDFPSIKVSRRS